MFSKIDNVVIIPLQKSDKFAGMVVLCNISEESRDGYIRFVPMLKVILENDIQNFGARQSSIHVEAEPERKRKKRVIYGIRCSRMGISVFFIRTASAGMWMPMKISCPGTIWSRVNFREKRTKSWGCMNSLKL